MAPSAAARQRRDPAAMRVGERASPGIGATCCPRLRGNRLRAAAAPLAAAVGPLHGFEQRARVRMRTALEQILWPALLDDAAEVNPRDLVAQIFHHREV